MMIHAAWLGYYWNGNDDPFDDPVHRLHLFVSSSDRLCFEYYYESRSNHGYDIEYHEGTVRSAGDGELVIDVAYRYETSWEDYFKEHRMETNTASQLRVIRIKALDAHNKPVLFYKDADMSFKCTDSVADSSFFARVRADSRAPEPEG